MKKMLGPDTTHGVWPQFRASTRGIPRVLQRRRCDLVRVQSG